ncbi:MAG: enoyl-CoA hydratase/isomerase family protein, partial [Chloroflexi bacterium]|nr:enoyl-CoA hydratase/isomerase family protein [Chloroflexota bacterium]
MSYQYILYEKRDRIAYVTINRPEVLNAINPPTSGELNHVWEDYMADTGLWVAILTGAGDRSFSVGADLKWRASQGERVRDPSYHDAAWGVAAQCLKPIIAAVNGYALGGGMALAMDCDIIIAADHAQFGMPEPRIGYWVDDRVLKRIPYHLAMGIALTGKRFSAQEAYRMGLVNEVVPLDKLMPTAQQWAQEILECS